MPARTEAMQAFGNRINLEPSRVVAQERRYDVREIMQSARWTQGQPSLLEPSLVAWHGAACYTVRATRLPRGWWERIRFALRPPRSEIVWCQVMTVYTIAAYEVKANDTPEQLTSLFRSRQEMALISLQRLLVAMFRDKDPFSGSPEIKDDVYWRWLIGGKDKAPMFEWPVLLQVL